MEIFIILAIAFIVCCILIPADKSTPKQRQKRRSRSDNEYWTGLPWMGGKKKKKKNFWDD